MSPARYPPSTSRIHPNLESRENVFHSLCFILGDDTLSHVATLQVTRGTGRTLCIVLYRNCRLVFVCLTDIFSVVFVYLYFLVWFIFSIFYLFIQIVVRYNSPHPTLGSCQIVYTSLVNSSLFFLMLLFKSDRYVFLTQVCNQE